MGQCFSTNLLPLHSPYSLLALITLTQGESITYQVYKSDKATSCPDAGPADKCVLYCDTKDNNDRTGFNCGIAFECDIHCDEKKCLYLGDIDARFVGDSLNIYGNGDQCFKNAQITLPNTANAYFTLTHKALREATITAGTNTQNIIIDCTAEKGDECKGLSVDAKTAQFLKIIVGKNSELYGDGDAANIYCPQHSNYNGAELASCVFDLTGGGFLYLTDIHTINGIPADVYIHTGDTKMQQVTIICDNGQSLNNGNEWDQTSACWYSPEPTFSPTIAKTTINPTINPTIYPTTSPTTAPTTVNPTANPTTATPTTRNPTLSPTGYPTTAIPTTRTPTTQNYTYNPTSSPTTAIPTTRIPTTFSPSDEPTIAPSINPTTAEPTTANPTTRNPTTVGDDCVEQCEAEPYNAKHCQAVNIGILCTDADNECHAQCMITRDIDIAKEMFNNDKDIVIYDQLSALTADERYSAYCGDETCADAATHTTTKGTTTELWTTPYVTNYSDDFDFTGVWSASEQAEVNVGLIVIVLLFSVMIFFGFCAVFIRVLRRSQYIRHLKELTEQSLQQRNKDIKEEFQVYGDDKKVKTQATDEHKENELKTGEYQLTAPITPITPQTPGLTDKEHKYIELKQLKIASCIAAPYGCLAGFCGTIVAMTLFAVYIALQPLCFSFNFSDFKVLNSEISNNQYQYILAHETAYDVLGEELSLRRRLENIDDGIDIEGTRRSRQLLYSKHGLQLYSREDYFYRAMALDTMTVFYYAQNGDNILCAELLHMVHAIEQGIKSYNGYSNHSLLYEVEDANMKQLFGYTGRQLFLEAAPGSFLNYIYPSTISGNYLYDGNGDVLTLINGNIGDTIQSLIRDHTEFLTDLFDFSFTFENVTSKYLAGVYPFSIQNMYETELELYEWVASFKPELFDKLDSSLRSNIGIAVVDTKLYILNNELNEYLNQDLKLAITSLVIIYLVLYVYCRSLYITTLGIFGVILSFIPCFAMYRMLWGESFNIINLVAIWVILGIGCDDIMVFISCYRRAPLEDMDGGAIPNRLRLAFAYRQAASAMFVTSFTTAFSFFSLCLSSINPLPQFGWFLGSLVITNFIIVMTWFPVVLQSYVWFVMGTIEYNFHIQKCTDRLAVAVPLPSDEIYEDSVPQSVMAVMTLQSKYFALPSAQRRKTEWTDGFDIDDEEEEKWMAKTVKALANEEDNASDDTFGDCTNLYFIFMRRGLGITLIVFIIALTVLFSITATKLRLAEETAELLPDYTNWGKVNIAFHHLNIDTEQYSGYSAASGSSSGAATMTLGTNRPTPSPTAPTIVTTRNPTTLKPTLAPTTDDPTMSPTTAYPTLSPTTAYPTVSPTTAEPTTLEPTYNPTISMHPTTAPTKRPTTAVPLDPVYKCINDGYDLICKADEFLNNNESTTLMRQQIALVFEGGGLYNAFNVSWRDDIIACPYPNNYSLFYDEKVYISPQGYDVKWCFYDDSPFPESEPLFEMETPYSSLMVTDWYRVSMWLYFNSEWNIIENKQGDLWSNYSLDILGIADGDGDILSIDESVTINLLFGTLESTEFSTNCDGEITSGEVIYDSSFNIYAFSAQKRWLQLCSELEAIEDDIMYRKDNDQEHCFAFAFNAYLHNSSLGPRKSMPNEETLIESSFNEWMENFIAQSSAVLYSESLIGLNPRIYRNWFGTKTRNAFSRNSSIAWIQQSVRTQMNKEWNGYKMWQYYEKWEKWMNSFNENSAESFIGIQTSTSYIRMEVEVAFINGFIQSVAYTLLLCSIVMIFFTQNLYLVLCVSLYILMICIFVVGMFGAFGWRFGIIEVISVPTVVGLSIDYALHITHAYIHSPFPDRVNRAKSAVNDLGSSVFASAMTTICSMVILYFAAIIMFSDLGFAVGTTTAFGVAITLLVLPPFLMYTGPQYNECHIMWFINKDGFSIRGYTFCKNKWFAINDDNYNKNDDNIDTDVAGDTKHNIRKKKFKPKPKSKTIDYLGSSTDDDDIKSDSDITTVRKKKFKPKNSKKQMDDMETKSEGDMDTKETMTRKKKFKPKNTKKKRDKDEDNYSNASRDTVGSSQNNDVVIEQIEIELGQKVDKGDDFEFYD